MLSDRELLFHPNVVLAGSIDEAMASNVVRQISRVFAGSDDLVLEVSTTGGDADAARRIALEIRLFREHADRNVYCVGKSYVYSAGVTVFAAFPCQSRYLTRDTVLLVHERRLDSTITFKGPLKSCLQIAREQVALLETAHELEMEGFRELVDGSSLSVEELYDRATENCYIKAEEALKLGLVARILE